MKNKRTLLALVLALFMLSAFCVQSFAAQSIRGDVDGDGEVNTDDAVYFLQYSLFGKIYPDMFPMNQSADMDGDGDFSQMDVVRLLQHVLFPTFVELAPDTAEHTHSWLEANCNTPKTCSVCGVTEGEPLGHSFEIVVTPPTCASYGYTTYVCTVCDAVSEPDGYVPPTGEHTFLEGICTVCGKVEPDGSCTHEPTEYVMLNFAEFGCCEGYLNYFTCECGETILPTNSSFNCEMEENTVTNEGVGSDGSIWQEVSTTAVCKICGLKGSVESKLVQTGCYVTVDGYFEFYTASGDLIDVLDFSMSDAVHSWPDEPSALGISDRTCGTEIYVLRCEDCGEMLAFYGIDQGGCNFVLNKYEDTDDENHYYYIASESCSDCGLYIEQVVNRESLEACMMQTSGRILVTINGEELLCLEEKIYEADHDVECTYELYGDTCDDGYLCTEMCKVCGYTDTYESDGHSGKYIDVGVTGGDSGFCGLSGECFTCNICGWEDTYIYSEHCDWGLLESEDGYSSVLVCRTCGAYRYEKYDRTEKDENCNYTETRTFEYYLDGALIYEYARTRVYSYHVYEYSFEFEGEVDCESGVKVYIACVDCGYTDWYRSYSHDVFELYRADMTELGCCEGHWFSHYGCPCGEVSDVNCNLYGYSCDQCGIGVFCDEEYEYSGCTSITTATYTLSKYGSEIYSCDVEYCSVAHSFDYSAALNDDGSYVVEMVCTNCGSSYVSDNSAPESYTAVLEERYDGSYTYEFVFTPDESGSYTIESNSNEDTYVTLYQLVDGEYIYLTSNDDGSGNGLNFKLEYYLSEGETYIYEITYLDRYLNHGDISFTIGKGLSSGDESCTSHYFNYVYVLPEVSEACGALEIYMCSCGYVEQIYVLDDHQTDLIYSADMTALGCCSYHYFEHYSCACGENCWISCDTDYCADCGLSINWRENASDSCYRDIVEYCVLLVNDEEVYRAITGEYSQIEHYFEYDASIDEYGNIFLNYECLGCGVSYNNSTVVVDEKCDHRRGREWYLLPEGHDSCEDGVIYVYLCTCGHIYELYATMEHEPHWNSSESVWLWLPNYGACDGWVESRPCACGEVTRVYRDFYGCDFSYEDYSYTDEFGVGHLVTTRSCSNCGLVEIIDSYYDSEGYEYTVFTYSINGVEIASLTEKLPPLDEDGWTPID